MEDGTELYLEEEDTKEVNTTGEEEYDGFNYCELVKFTILCTFLSLFIPWSAAATKIHQHLQQRTDGVSQKQNLAPVDNKAAGSPTTIGADTDTAATTHVTYGLEKWGFLCARLHEGYIL